MQRVGASIASDDSASSTEDTRWPWRQIGDSIGRTPKTQTAFAARIGWTKTRLNELIRGKRGVTADAALDLAEALGTSSRIWMNLQSAWDLDTATRRRRSAA